VPTDNNALSSIW